MMNGLRKFVLAAWVLSLAACASKPDQGPEVVGETSGTLSRLRLDSGETGVLKNGAQSYFNNIAGPQTSGTSRGNSDGDFITGGDLSFSAFRFTGEPRTMRGNSEELAILPYAAKFHSSAGGGEFKSYILATRGIRQSRWSYIEAFYVDRPALFRRFPGLKETNAVPTFNASLAGAHPALRKGYGE